MAKKRKRTKRARRRIDPIGKKIGILLREGYGSKQAAAIAYSMARAGKLGKRAKVLARKRRPAKRRRTR